MSAAPQIPDPSYHELTPERRGLVYILSSSGAAAGKLEELQDRLAYRPAGDVDPFTETLRSHGFVLVPCGSVWRVAEERYRELHEDRAERAEQKARRLARQIKRRRNEYPACVLAGLELAAATHRRKARQARAKVAATFLPSLSQAMSAASLVTNESDVE